MPVRKFRSVEEMDGPIWHAPGGARDTERIWREIAQRGDGRYIPIPQDGGKIVIIETPFDTEIIELQGRINGTVIP